MKKNGKIIKCKVCQKEFYISKSRFNSKRYCSWDCANKDNFGFKPKKKKCIICGKEFTITSGIQTQKKTCSYKCWKKNNYAISKKRCSTKTIKKCKKCGKEFESLKYVLGTSKCKDCRFKELSEKRIGKNNPNYKDGHATKKKFGGRRSIYTEKHFKACIKYRKAFLEKHDYLSCEECGVNINGTSHFEVHHLYFASLYPRHKELHNFKNLILLCKQCHGNYHNGNQGKELLRKKEKERGLKKLFGSNF